MQLLEDLNIAPQKIRIEEGHDMSITGEYVFVGKDNTFAYYGIAAYPDSYTWYIRFSDLYRLIANGIVSII